MLEATLLKQPENWTGSAAVLTRSTRIATVKKRRLHEMDYPTGWTCARTGLSFEHYLRSTLVLAESLAVAEHLEACEGCAQQLILFRVTITKPGHD
jgi:hypothetical protein